MLLIALVVGGAGCGREAPFFSPGSLTVTSTPPGATIWLDGQDTGQVTPHTFSGLAADLYTVSVTLTDYVATPQSAPVELQPLDNLLVDFALSQTGLAVGSSPPGARVFIDGTDTGQVTPAVIAGLEPGTVEVSLALDTYLVAPATLQVTVLENQVVDVPASSFALRSQKTVMLEGFSNVNCGPCPELTGNLLALTSQPAFSPDRVLFIEFSVNWPNPSDPLYLDNATENTDRYTTYFVLGAPALYLDGVPRDDALDATALAADVTAAWQQDPGFLLDVTADFSNPTVPVTVTLDPRVDRDLTGYVLFVALYETEVAFATAPGTNGQTEFHHVFRDRVDTSPGLGALTGGTPTDFNLTLNRGDRDPANLVVVAFVQHGEDLDVLQAGSTALTAKASATSFRTAAAHAETLRPERDEP